MQSSADSATGVPAPGDSAGSNRAPGDRALAKSLAWTESPFRVLMVALIAGLLLTVIALAANTEPIELSGPGSPNTVNLDSVRGEQPPADESVEATQVNDVEPFEPVEIPRAILIGLGVIAAIAALYFLSLQRIALKLRRSKVPITSATPKLTAEEEATEIVRFTRDLIDELKDGDDPRLAIQRAYAAVETGLGTDELARKPAETPLNYLTRVFGRNQDAAAPLEQLTKLFEVARFSQTPIDESMRSEAIHHLAEIRERYKDQLASKALVFKTRAL